MIVELCTAVFTSVVTVLAYRYIHQLLKRNDIETPWILSDAKADVATGSVNQKVLVYDDEDSAWRSREKVVTAREIFNEIYEDNPKNSKGLRAQLVKRAMALIPYYTWIKNEVESAERLKKSGYLLDETYYSRKDEEKFMEQEKSEIIGFANSMQNGLAEQIFHQAQTFLQHETQLKDKKRSAKDKMAIDTARKQQAAIETARKTAKSMAAMKELLEEEGINESDLRTDAGTKSAGKKNKKKNKKK
eukprot:CFRG1278T1